MVTLKQLAKELNVSISTVSKALNDSEEIGEATIKRVKELAKYYNYKPNKLAQSLKSNRTNTVGVIIPNILNRFFARVLVGLEKEALSHGFNIITCMSNESIEREKESLHLLADGSVDGFILSVAEETQKQNDGAHFEHTLNDQGLPIVMFDRVMDGITCDKVVIDDLQATFEATLRLIQYGCKSIAFISNIDDLNLGKLREAGFHKALEEHGLDNKALVLRIQNDLDWPSQIRTFLESNPGIDGILAADNISGVMTINMAKSLGFKVPEDIAVLGFADSIVSQLSIPRLSTIHQDAEAIGKTAFSLLHQRLNAKDDIYEPQTRVIKTQFISNGSTPAK